MDVIGNNAPTLVDAAGTLHNGKMLPIAEVLAEDNPILQDMPMLEANEVFGHRYSVRTSLPSGSYRKLNEGVSTEKSTKRPEYADLAMLETYSEVDARLVDNHPDPATYRFQEDMAFVEGLSQTQAGTVFYGNNSTDPSKFDGLATRINSLSSTSDNGRANVIGASGTGSDTTSIWVVQWGVRRVYGIYPKGSAAGLNMANKGQVTVEDGNGNKYEAYRSHFAWDLGLIIEDNRCVQRIANIETAGSSNIFDEDDLITALNRLPYSGRGAVVYCNPTIKTQIDINAKDKSNVNYTASDVYGNSVTSFRGVPIRVCDAILDTETAIS